MFRFRLFYACLVALLLGGLSAHARNVGSAAPGILNETPAELKDIGIDEHLGAAVDLNLHFRDEDGKDVTLAKYINGQKPVILDLAYYSCPSLCNFHLNGMNDAMRSIPWTLGKEFEMVVVSINPQEKPVLAAAKKASYVTAYGRPEGANGWHFLTGEEKDIAILAKQVGFKYRWDQTQKQYAHASAAYVLTPSGKISRYLYGVVIPDKTLRLSLVEAGEDKIGTIVDKLTLWCFHYDPQTNKYGVMAGRIMQAGGIAIVLIMTAFFLPFWVRSRSKNQDQGEV